MTHDVELRGLVGVITSNNFFVNGTLKENVSWKVPDFDDVEADKMARELQMEEDLRNYR
jgi:ABC-type bacteriocin/lantibiotic exporter with double-glycine peptidase domain